MTGPQKILAKNNIDVDFANYYNQAKEILRLNYSRTNRIVVEKIAISSALEKIANKYSVYSENHIMIKNLIKDII